MTEKRSGLDRILTAFNHPVRRVILRELVDGRVSASTVARKHRMELGVVSYHLNRVLARQCRVTELVDSVPNRGSIEKFYELRAAGPLDLPAAGEPGSRDEMLWALTLGQKLFEATEGARGKK